VNEFTPALSSGHEGTGSGNSRLTARPLPDGRWLQFGGEADAVDARKRRHSVSICRPRFNQTVAPDVTVA